MEFPKELWNLLNYLVILKHQNLLFYTGSHFQALTKCYLALNLYELSVRNIILIILLKNL